MWHDFQKRYVEWANAPLPEDYRRQVTETFRKFNAWIQLDQCKGLILDVGCGNGKIGNMTYQQFFGFDDSTRPNWIGIDPLFGRCTVRGVVENLPFQDRVFQKAIVYTSLDHFRNLDSALQEMLRVASEVDLLFTDTGTTTSDNAHPYRVTTQTLQKLQPTYLREGNQVYAKIISTPTNT